MKTHLATFKASIRLLLSAQTQIVYDDTHDEVDDETNDDSDKEFLAVPVVLYPVPKKFE